MEHTPLNDIPGIVAENTYAVLQKPRIHLLCRIGSLLHGGIICAPGLPIEHFFPGTESLVQLPADSVHQLHRQQSHEIKPEAVQMIFPGPVHHGIRNVIVHHGAPCGYIVPAGGAVGESAVLHKPVIIPRNHPLEPGIPSVGMVVDHVHNHPDAACVQSLDHLLALTDPHQTVHGVCGIGTLGDVVVHRIIPPVELFPIPGFVHRSKVKKRKQMYMGNAQTFQVLHAGGMLSPLPRHRKSLVFSAESFRHTAGRIVGEILDMQLIDDPFRPRLRRTVRVKSRRIGLSQIHRQAPVPIAAAAHRIGIRRADFPSSCSHQIIIVGAMEVFRKFPVPNPLFSPLHLLLYVGRRRPVLIETQTEPLRQRAPHLKYRPSLPAVRAQILPLIAELCVNLLTGKH